MPTLPAEVILELNPRARFDLINVSELLSAAHGDLLHAFPRALYCSLHTTAGYLSQRLAARLSSGRQDGVAPYVQLFQTIFPPGADYQHDKLHLRAELSEEQRRVEPRNADSHLAFIGAGLRTCVSYVNRPGEPVYFVDLDGMCSGQQRRRSTSIVGFNTEEIVAQERLRVPVSAHPVDSVNLRDPRLGVYQQLGELVTRHGVVKGRLRLTLAPGERQAGLTVNEYETLLMRHDLVEVLRNPLRFMYEKGRHLIADPRAIPNKTIDYAKYDLVRVLNELLDTFGQNESLIETILARVIAYPASRFLHMKRSVSLLVSDREVSGRGSLVSGPYQSPIVVQWDRAAKQERLLDVTLTRLQ